MWGCCKQAAAWASTRNRLTLRGSSAEVDGRTLRATRRLSDFCTAS